MPHPLHEEVVRGGAVGEEDEEEEDTLDEENEDGGGGVSEGGVVPVVGRPRGELISNLGKVVNER